MSDHYSSKRPEENDATTKKRRGALIAANLIIVICIAIILSVTFLSLRDPGITVRFDSRGGSDVQFQKLQYDELLAEPQPPTREGYTFAGWYKDPSYDMLWDFSTDRVTEELTLYACWQKQ